MCGATPNEMFDLSVCEVIEWNKWVVNFSERIFGTLKILTEPINLKFPRLINNLLKLTKLSLQNDFYQPTNS